MLKSTPVMKQPNNQTYANHYAKHIYATIYLGTCPYDNNCLHKLQREKVQKKKKKIRGGLKQNQFHL